MKVHLDRVRAKPAVTPLVSGGLGWFSIALGVAEIAAAGPIARALGLPPAAAWLIRGFGAREIATGVGVLSAPANPQWLMARVGGDALDLSALACAARPGNPTRNNALAATATAVVMWTAPTKPRRLTARVDVGARTLSALAFAARTGNPRRNNARAATAAVAGVTAIDAIASGRLARLKTSSSGQKYLREAA